MSGFNIDESPINRDWTRSEWNIPAYRSKAFFQWLAKNSLTLVAFKQTAKYRLAVLEGLIVNDKWVPKSKRKNQRK